ncbi:MAG: hypothetical protein CMI90_04560 [Pelagibacteraceae bacterium]|nr:hypothetical protein [Pelagibacteraceae bacterium]
MPLFIFQLLKKKNQKKFLPDIIKVVGGLIINKGSILIAQRNKNQTHPLKWEFPGGKVRIDEEVKSALEREIKEELSLKI